MRGLQGKISACENAMILFFANNIVAYIPFWCLRRFFYSLMGLQIGCGTSINMRQYLLGPGIFRIGEFSHINPSCLLDYRGGIEIGNCVSISHRVMLITGGHDVQSGNFQEEHRPIKIGDHVWIGAGATILKGIEISEGTVVAADYRERYFLPSLSTVSTAVRRLADDLQIDFIDEVYRIIDPLFAHHLRKTVSV
jgi:serine acetyltransferase